MNTLYNVCSYFWNPATTASSTPEEDTDLYTEDGWIMVNGENEIPSSLQQSKIQPNQEELLQVIERINQIIKELKSPTTDQLFKLLDEMHDENGIVLGPIISGRAIREIKMMKLNQSSKLVPLTVMIIRSFFLLKENGRLREETKKIIDTFFGEVDQCTGISFDSPLYTFTELSLQLEKLNSVDKVSEDYLITLNKMGGIELTVEDNVDHLSVSKKLTQLLFNLDRGILSQINNASLRELLYATLFLFTNYSKLLLKDSSKENVQCIVNILQKTLGILRNQIESNNKKTSKCSDEQFMFENLSNKLKSLGFHNINQAKKNYEQLCSLEPALSQIKGAIFKYNYYRYLSAGLIRISETSNICISRTANSETLVIYYSGSDNAFDLKNHVSNQHIG